MLTGAKFDLPQKSLNVKMLLKSGGVLISELTAITSLQSID
jgi:hypothetical protein